MLKSLGAEVVQGDYDALKSCDLALEGIWGVYAVQNTWEAGVEREEEQGKRFAFTSTFAASYYPGARQPSDHNTFIYLRTPS